MSSFITLMQTLQLVVILGGLVWAVATDIYYREISDVLCGMLFILGFVYQFMIGSWQEAILSFAITFLVSLLLFRLEVFGGGDLKLFIALAVFGGLPWCFRVFYYSLLAALPLFAVYVVKERNWKPSVPYAVAILGGAILEQFHPLLAV